jgi:hypothetical protein
MTNHSKMASETLTQQPLDSLAVPITANAEQPRPIEALEVEEPHNDEENIVFPTGPKLWSTMASMAITCFLSGLVSQTWTLSSVTQEAFSPTPTGPHYCSRGRTKYYR